MYSSIISTNTKPHLSGVARFGYLLAKRFGVPYLGFDNLKQLKKETHLLLSVSYGYQDIQLEAQTWRFLSLIKEKNLTYNLFFHSYDKLPIEQALLKSADKVYVANEEIAQQIEEKSGVKTRALWSPSLIESLATYEHKYELEIFSFGMAFKIQSHFHKLLEQKLRKMKIDYIIRFSTGFHEKAYFGNYDVIAHQLEDIYKERVEFLGFLSDEGVDHFIGASDLYVNFFAKGARANNTTLYAVMERGKPVLTNLDEYSPFWMKPGVNMVNLHELESIDLRNGQLKKIGKQAKKDSKKYTNWKKLVEELK